MVGVGIVAAFWTLAQSLSGHHELGDRDAPAGFTALATIEALVGLAVALHLKRLVRLVAQAA